MVSTAAQLALFALGPKNKLKPLKQQGQVRKQSKPQWVRARPEDLSGANWMKVAEKMLLNYAAAPEASLRRRHKPTKLTNWRAAASSVADGETSLMYQIS